MSASEVRLERAMNLSIAEGTLATVMGTLLSGLFLTGFALELGVSRLQIGIMAALPTLVHPAQFLGAWILNRTGRSKRVCLTAAWTSRLLWLPILLVPTLLGHWSGEAKGWCVIGLLALSSALGSIAGLAWLDWIKRLIPEERRVPFFARRSWYNSGLSLGMGVAAAVLITFWSKESVTSSTGGFIAVFTIAMLCGIVGAYLLGRIQPADATEPATMAGAASFLQPLRSQNYRQLLTGYAVWQFANQLAAPFFAVYMLQKLNMPFWAVTALTTMGGIVALSSNSAWMRLKLRFGVRPVVLFATLADVLLPFCWLFVQPGTLWLLIPIHFFSIFSPPIGMGPNNLLLKIAPNRNSASYLALFNASTGAIGAAGAVFGGWLAMTLQGEWHVMEMELTGIQLVFLLSCIGKLAGFALLQRIEEAGSLPMSDLVRHLKLPIVGRRAAVALTSSVPSNPEGSAPSSDRIAA